MLVCLNSPSGDSGIESYAEGAITILESLPYARTVRELIVFGFTVTDAHQPFANLVSALSAYMTQWRSLLLLAVSSPKVGCVARIGALADCLRHPPRLDAARSFGRRACRAQRPKPATRVGASAG